MMRMKLDNPSMLYLWKDAIKGAVDLPVDAQCSIVRVAFSGRAKTKIWEPNGQRTSIFRARAPLLQEEIVTDCYRDVAGMRRWNFIFHVPSSPDAHQLAGIVASRSSY